MIQLNSSSQVFVSDQFGLGTVGGFFKFNNNDVYGISNNHVIAGLNKCHVGDPVFLAGGDDPPMVGTLQCWVTLESTAVNYLDIALFKVESGVDIGWLLPQGTQMPQQFDPPADADQVYLVRPDGSKRVGNISNPRIGFNTSFSLSGATFSFTNLIEITTNDRKPFSKHGESGSLIFNSVHNIIGILLGTNAVETKSYAVPFLNGKLGITGTYNLSITGGPAILMPDDEQA